MSITAEERKRRFRAAREAAGGIENLIAQIQQRPWVVYFNNQGRITGYEKADPKTVTKQHIVVSKEQIEQIMDRPANYCVVEHPRQANCYVLEEIVFPGTTISVDNMPTKIHHCDNPEIVVELDPDTLSVSITDLGEKLYLNIEPDLARARGQTELEFWICAPNDPHIVLSECSFSLRDLLTQKFLSVALDQDISQADVFTFPVFDKYSRTHRDQT